MDGGTSEAEPEPSREATPSLLADVEPLFGPLGRLLLDSVWDGGGRGGGGRGVTAITYNVAFKEHVAFCYDDPYPISSSLTFTKG